MSDLASYKAHYSALFRLGIPIIIGQMGMIVLDFADTAMIGQHSTMELAAASFVTNVMNLLIVFCLGFSYGLLPIVGALYGKKKYAKVGVSLKNSLAANTLVALIITLVLLVFYLFIDKMGQPEELLPLIRIYFWSKLPTVLLLLLFSAFKQFSDSITDTRTGMWLLLSGNFLNILLNYLLIYGHWGCPELGLLGAGIATTISRLGMTLAFAAIFLFTRHYAVYRAGFHAGRLNLALFKRLNLLGWPIATQTGLEAASFCLCAIMMGWLGADALAAHQIVSTVSTLCFMVYMGMGAAIAVRVSNFNGQNDWGNLRRTSYAGCHIILLFALLMSLCIFLLRFHISGIFTESEEVSHLVVALVFPLLIYQFGDVIQITFSNVLRAIADVKAMMYIAFVAYFLISFPLSYIFGFVLHWGAVGIWMGLPFGLSTAGLFYFLRFRYHLRRQHLA
ncbi:MAG: MATE family efflux transporter [Bacteroidaceae bacterium]